MTKRYNLKYKIEPGRFTAEELKKDNSGGTDQLLICSYVESPDGSGSYLWISSNGKPKEEMAFYRKLHCFSLLAKTLSEDPNVGPGVKAWCNEIFERFRAVILTSKDTIG